MKMQFTVLGSLFMWSWVLVAGRVEAQELTLGARIQSLESKLQKIEAQLGKLEFIAQDIGKIRNEDLPKIQRDLRGTLETSGRTDNFAPPAGSDEPPLPDEVAPTVSSPTEQSVLDEPTGGDIDKFFNDDATTEEDQQAAFERRAKTLEDTMRAIERHLDLLDTIAERLNALRNEDLVRLQRDVRGLRETSAGGDEVADPGAASGGEAVVIINNMTSVAHQVSINDVNHSIPPGKYRVTTKYGPLKTQLTEFAEPQTWDFTRWKKVGDEYQMSFDLKP